MTGILVDSNVILDLVTDDPTWAGWSEVMLNHYDRQGRLFINDIVFAEVSIGFERIEECDEMIARGGFCTLPIPREALFLAGKVYLQYRRSGGKRTSPLPDFFIGAHAAVSRLPLLSRDRGRYRTYFPTVELITPES
ncbi:MAG: type II toxin-antitoxin system VapC family toxin [Geothermobacteraceae bacterium]